MVNVIRIILPKIGLVIIFNAFCCLVFAQETTSAVAKTYLFEYLDIVQKRSINRGSIDWEEFETVLFDAAKNAQTVEETYPAIKKSLKLLEDGHSFLMTAQETDEWKRPENSEEIKDTIPGPVPYGKLIDGVGYINLPWFHSGNERSCQLFADTLLSVIRTLDKGKLKGWIVDLRGNLGGNNWPMHAGISPLYTNDIIGAYVYPNGETKNWTVRENAVYDNDSIIGRTSEAYTLKNKNLPIAVLIDRSTASSGETVLVSFIGEKNAKTFGQPSWGSTTCNDLFPLSDGAQLLLTVAVYADRNGKSYNGPIKPDVLIENEQVVQEAIRWINEQ